MFRGSRAIESPAVRIREGTRWLVVLCAAGAVGLIFAAPGVAAAPNSPQPPAPQPGIDLELKGVKHGKLRVAKHARVFGTARPFVPGQQVTVTLFKGDRELKTELVAVKQGEGDAGHFQLRSPVLVKPGHYVATAELAGNPQVGARSHKFKVKYPSLHHGSKGKDVKVFNRLLDKQGYVPSRGRKYSSRTGRAVLAYRKVHGMAPITRATSGIFKKLAGGKGAYKLKHPGAGRHAEVSIGRQVLVLADNGKAQRTYPVSTGKSSTPTVRGQFRFYRRQPGFNGVGMYYSVYFHGGYAVHGYHDVPARYPASHGCVRTPIPDARSIYNWVSIGMSIYVY
jgi:lipoprotein-anchoring transpeptidase ErfK/SrfK